MPYLTVPKGTVTTPDAVYRDARFTVRGLGATVYDKAGRVLWSAQIKGASKRGDLTVVTLANDLTVTVRKTCNCR